MTISVGDILKDNDPRMHKRMLYVRKVQAGYVHAAMQPMGTRLTRVRLDRVHEDDKPRATGYNRIQPTKERVTRPSGRS